MKEKLKKLSCGCFLLAAVTFAIDYICFHFLTDSGFTTVWQLEAGKPFATELVGQLGVLFLFAKGFPASNCQTVVKPLSVRKWKQI